jgi:hypothetical protein
LPLHHHLHHYSAKPDKLCAKERTLVIQEIILPLSLKFGDAHKNYELIKHDLLASVLLLLLHKPAVRSQKPGVTVGVLHGKEVPRTIKKLIL